MIPMPPVQFAEINGLRMAYYEAGPRVGTPVIFSHGFPELAFSWRHQLKALSDADRWVVAPDQRGYGDTPGPAEVEAYDMEHLAGDLVGLLDHLGAEKAIWCGHDWGGIVAWQMPLLHPERTAGVIGLNTPFIPRGPTDLVTAYRKRYGEDMYIVHFQTPGEADAILDADPERTMKFFMRRPAQILEDHFTKSDGAGGSFALVKAVAAYDPARDRRGEFLSEDELKVFVEAFRRTGFTGGINWYRNFRRNWERSADLPQRVEQPSLMIMAEHDAILSPRLADGMEAFVPDLEKVLIQDSGHWTQQEKPDEVNTVILDWLNRRFPANER